MMIDEEIKHVEEVADTCEYEASKYDMSDSYERHVACQEGECAKEHRQLAEWLRELKQLREQTRWIPVSERLPENDEDVLVCFPQGSMAVAYYHIDDTYYPTQYEDLNDTGWFNEESDVFYFDPIAWMPLPEPYKVESEEYV